MNLFLITFIFFGCFIALMGLGVIFSNRRIQGSCGGLNAVMTNESGEKICGVCGISVNDAKTTACGNETIQSKMDSQA